MVPSYTPPLSGRIFLYRNKAAQVGSILGKSHLTFEEVSFLNFAVESIFMMFHIWGLFGDFESLLISTPPPIIHLGYQKERFEVSDHECAKLWSVVLATLMLYRFDKCCTLRAIFLNSVPLSQELGLIPLIGRFSVSTLSTERYASNGVTAKAY